MLDQDSTQTSRARLLDSGKALFARYGYEQTPTAAIAREAGTSESQLVRYYKGKAGLLEAIFNECWSSLNEKIQGHVVAAKDAREALVTVLSGVIEEFSKDHDLAYLLLFEGRRVRSGGSDIVLSRGFTEFDNLLQVLVRRGKRDGTFGETLPDPAVAAALMGAVEAMIRERIMAERAGKPNPFSDADIRSVFGLILDGLSRGGATQREAR